MTAPARFRLADASIRIDSLPPEGRDLRAAATDAERDELAARLDISAIERLEVNLHADRFKGGIRVTGRLGAQIVQPSVVTLEPVRQVIEEQVDRVFLPAGGKDLAGSADAEIFVDPEGEDVPDHFEGAEADLSDLIVETLALAIDPYPRLEGESIEDIGIAPGADGPASPFAVLAGLKPPDRKGS